MKERAVRSMHKKQRNPLAAPGNPKWNKVAEIRNRVLMGETLGKGARRTCLEQQPKRNRDSEVGFDLHYCAQRPERITACREKVGFSGEWNIPDHILPDLRNRPFRVVAKYTVGWFLRPTRRRALEKPRASDLALRREWQGRVTHPSCRDLPRGQHGPG